MQLVLLGFHEFRRSPQARSAAPPGSRTAHRAAGRSGAPSPMRRRAPVAYPVAGRPTGRQPAGPGRQSPSRPYRAAGGRRSTRAPVPAPGTGLPRESSCNRRKCGRGNTVPKRSTTMACRAPSDRPATSIDSVGSRVSRIAASCAALLGGRLASRTATAFVGDATRQNPRTPRLARSSHCSSSTATRTGWSAARRRRVDSVAIPSVRCSGVRISSSRSSAAASARR